MLKEWAIAKALQTAFKIGLKNDTPEKTALVIIDLLNKQVGNKNSKEIQKDFVYFAVEFIGRISRKMKTQRETK